MNISVEKESRIAEIQLDGSSVDNCKKILETTYLPDNAFAQEPGTVLSVAMAVEDLYKLMWITTRSTVRSAGLSPTGVEQFRRQVLLIAYQEVFSQISGDFDVNIHFSEEIR